MDTKKVQHKKRHINESPMTVPISNLMTRNRPTPQNMKWTNIIPRTPPMLTERLSQPRSMMNSQNHWSLIKVGDWNSPAGVDKFIQVKETVVHSLTFCKYF